MVLFLSTDCLSCKAIAAELEDVRQDWTDGLALALVLQGRSEEERAAFLLAADLDGDGAIFDEHGAIGGNLGVTVRPAALLVREWRLAEAVAVANGSQLRRFGVSALESVENNDEEVVLTAM